MKSARRWVVLGALTVLGAPGAAEAACDAELRIVNSTNRAIYVREIFVRRQSDNQKKRFWKRDSYHGTQILKAKGGNTELFSKKISGFAADDLVKYEIRYRKKLGEKFFSDSAPELGGRKIKYGEWRACGERHKKKVN